MNEKNLVRQVNFDTVLNRDRIACAPYNFVPLPDEVAEAVANADQLPPHNIYETNEEPYRYSGRFEVTLRTFAPLFVRGGLSRTAKTHLGLEEWAQLAAERENKDERVKHLDYSARMKNRPHFFTKGHTVNPATGEPVIPGSSIRGMLRMLLEIVAFGKLSGVNDRDVFFFRAVAADSDSPLKDLYRRTLNDVRAGYLEREGNHWYIQPALQPDPSLFYAKVEDETLDRTLLSLAAVPKLSSGKAYHPGCYPIHFTLRVVRGKIGKMAIATVVAASEPEAQPGWLVCSGNMAETGGGTKRAKFAVLRAANPNPDARLQIDPQAIQDYRNALTEYMKDYFDPEMGCLRQSYPVFYNQPKMGQQVRYYGSSPNFRVPFDLNRGGQPQNRAARLADFVPDRLKREEQIDYAEAIFGFIRLPKPGEKRADKQGDRSHAYASRVSVTEARLNRGMGGASTWLASEPITPKILATPKPSTFQHYLVQPTSSYSSLSHFGSKTPDQTVLRGFKMYFHQGSGMHDGQWRTHLLPLPTDPNMGKDGKPEPKSSQHTCIMPVRPRITFTFHIYFDNLSKAELGGLCWILAPQQEMTTNPIKQYFLHKLGMGKPLGMGSVHLQPTLTLTDRLERYASLFDTKYNWQTGNAEKLQPIHEDWQQFVRAFDEEVSQKLNLTGSLFSQERIRALLKMMAWPGSTAEYPASEINRAYKHGSQIANTRYMTIELPDVPSQDKNEYKSRPVLPGPLWKGFPDGAGSLLDAAILAKMQTKLTELEERLMKEIERGKNTNWGSGEKLANELRVVEEIPERSALAKRIVDWLRDYPNLNRIMTKPWYLWLKGESERD